MARYQGWFAFVLALAIAAGMFLVRTPLQLGLDLRGGSQLTVQVQPAGDVKLVGDREMEAVKAVLDRRVNGPGVAESTSRPLAPTSWCCSSPVNRTPPPRRGFLATRHCWSSAPSAKAPKLSFEACVSFNPRPEPSFNYGRTSEHAERHRMR